MDKILCVLSTGRSGTSLITKFSTSFDFRLSDRLLGGSSSNPKGHFEDSFILDKNVSFLNDIQKTLWSPFEEDDKFESLFNLNYRNQITSYLKNLVISKNKLLLKEPRVSKLLKYYKHIFDSLPCEVYYLLLYRNPNSYVKSSYESYKNSFFHGTEKNLYDLWYQINESILNNLNANDKIFALSFENFLSDTYYYLSKISNFVEEELNKKKFIELNTSFYDKNLVHYHYEENTEFEHVNNMYNMLKEFNTKRK